MSASNPLRLRVDTWKAKIVDYINAVAIKKEADSQAAAAERTIKALRSELKDAMKGANVALCGNAVLTTKETSGAEATLTLADGTKVAWKDVTSVLVGNRTILKRDIVTLYGGRAGSESLTVTGTP